MQRGAGPSHSPQNLPSPPKRPRPLPSAPSAPATPSAPLSCPEPESTRPRSADEALRPLHSAWALDPLGNSNTVTTDGTPQSRTHNSQNQITSQGISHDPNGNMTADQTGKTLVYDAWNRLVEARNGTTTVQKYEHDALGRRVQENLHVTGGQVGVYYTASWQAIEERKDATGATTTQYVWSPVYIDAMVERDRDTDGNGTLNERLYVQQDANFNVTSVSNSAGQVVQRFTYDPYGRKTTLNADWSAVTTDAYGILHGHQGGKLDPTTGLIHFRNREYSPELMRWVQQDPLGYVDGKSLYGYVRSSPVTLQDPTGEIVPALVVGGAIAIWLGMQQNAHAPEIGESPAYRQALEDYQAGQNFRTGTMIATLPIGLGMYGWTARGLEATGWETGYQIVGGAILGGGAHELAAEIATGDVFLDPEGFGERWLWNSAFYAIGGTLDAAQGGGRSIMQEWDEALAQSRRSCETSVPSALAQEMKGGGSWLMTERQFDLYAKGAQTIGRADGQFITSARQMNHLIQETGGSPVLLGERLGVSGWGPETRLIRMDVTDPMLFNPRMPTSSMSGANYQFRFGGFTSGGVPEMVIDPLPWHQVWSTPLR